MAWLLDGDRARGDTRDVRRFDRKFGPDFLASVPAEPGVYRFFDEAGAVVYVGKSKNLRKRLAQYRNAGPGRRGRKPRRLVKGAVAIDWQVAASELDASLEEVRLIQSLHPRENVASAFEFLYPLIGLRRTRDTLRFCLTARPERFEGYEFHGTFRNRETTGEAFFALMRLLGRVGHSEPRKALGGDDRLDEHSFVLGFRRLPAGYLASWSAFFRGEKESALGELACRLLEKPSARAKAAEVQSDLEALARFFADEARALRLAVTEVGLEVWPVPQSERDPLFLRFTHARAGA